MQLIHITNREEYNIAKRTLLAHGKKPFEIQPNYRGPCYMQNDDKYLILRQQDLVGVGTPEIIPFNQFIEEAI